MAENEWLQCISYNVDVLAYRVYSQNLSPANSFTEPNAWNQQPTQKLAVSRP